MGDLANTIADSIGAMIAALVVSCISSLLISIGVSIVVPLTPYLILKVFCLLWGVNLFTSLSKTKVI